MTASITPAAFVLEQHLGHRTYAENLRRVLDDRADLDARWVGIDYDVDVLGRLARAPLPGRVTSYLAGRRQVRDAVRSALAADAATTFVYNTQVPVAIGGRLARSRPYVAVTDVTPVQYDRMADGYGHRPDRPGPVAWWKHRRNRAVFGQAHRCVGWSSWAARSIVDDYGVDPARVEVIAPGVDTQRFRPGSDRHDDGTLRVLFVGGDFERKGGDDLRRAASSLPGDVHLTLVTRSAVATDDRTAVVGDLRPNDDRLVELFRSSDVFALPSAAETFGIAAVEASACGLPVVASASGGLSDVVDDGVTGFTVPPGDVAALADRLRRLADDGALRRRLGRAARQRALQRYDATTNARRLLDLVRDASRTGGPG